MHGINSYGNGSKMSNGVESINSGSSGISSGNYCSSGSSSSSSSCNVISLHRSSCIKSSDSGSIIDSRSNITTRFNINN